MPDTIISPTIQDEPLWSRRLNDRQRVNARFFREARKRDGRPIAYEALQQEKEGIEVVKDGRERPLTAQAKEAGMPQKSAQGRYGMTKSVGSGAAQRAGAGRVNDRAFERMKAEQKVEAMRTRKP